MKINRFYWAAVGTFLLDNVNFLLGLLFWVDIF